MGRLKLVWLAMCCLLMVCTGLAQDSSNVKFEFRKEKLSDNEQLFVVTAAVSPGIKLYPLQKKETDLLYSSIQFDTSAKNLLIGPVSETGKLQSETDSAVNAQVSYFTDSVVWQQKVRVDSNLVLKGTITYLFKKGDEYLPGEKQFKTTFTAAEPLIAASTNSSSVAQRSLLWIFLTAFGGGLLALLTPCVYSMIPVTVSYFTKRSKNRAHGVRNSLYYSSSIIIIFTLLGFLITLIFGPAALNNLATNWIANLFFFAVFLLFGISFLGAFEISLPSSWATRSDKQAGMHNFVGIFFMALTLVLVSFSCTGPIIGNLLVLAAQGSYYGPLVGMFGFSLALALPFALFAFFPSFLNKLGSAGGWLNSVKVTLGFLELALALKFLSNADLVKGWRFLDREIFISLWIVLFVLLGIYLLGKIKFHHDDELPKNDYGLPYLKIPRLFFAIAVFAFAVYMVPGLWGAPLKGISAFLPPMGTQDYIGGSTIINPPASNSSGSVDGPPHPVKYAERMKIYEPEVVKKYGMITYFDYDEALEVSKKLKKPLMIDFTGINCVNCRKMEGQVWSDSKVMQRLKEDFVIVSLYVDVHSIDLPEAEQYYSKSLEKQVETLGDRNADLQVTRFQANTQPYYFFLDAKENRLAPEGYGYDPSVNKFLQLLDQVKEEYQKRS